jgi:DNA-binding transcriptional MerR regulator
MNMLRLPAVEPVGYACLEFDGNAASALITRYLDHALPYRLIIISGGLSRYRNHLLDAMAGLLVQLHLAGVFWGDCSLSNTLFRRDAGALQAYLVDAETTELHVAHLEPTLRHHELEIMEENIAGDLAVLASGGQLPADFPAAATGPFIRQKYRALWDEVTREEIVAPDEHYQIQQRIRALNELGFSVGDIEMHPAGGGEKPRLRIFVTDRNFHRDQLHELTGLEAEEMQARQMINEIQELRAALSWQNGQNTPLNVAAYHWQEQFYLPTVGRLKPLIERRGADTLHSPTELYCQVLEHKWFLSERERRDVGHQVAVEDYLAQFARG